jgi:hypothetical protein
MYDDKPQGMVFGQEFREYQCFNDDVREYCFTPETRPDFCAARIFLGSITMQLSLVFA